MNAPSAVGPNQPCWCGSGQKYKKCHRDAEAAAAGARRVRPGRISPPREVPPEIPRPDYAATGRPGPGSPVDPDPARRLARMRRACRAAAEVLAECARALRPGLTTDAIDALCHAACLARGGYPSTPPAPRHRGGDAARHRGGQAGTVVTADGKRSAQFEHTIVVTRDGAEILTRL